MLIDTHIAYIYTQQQTNFLGAHESLEAYQVIFCHNTMGNKKSDDIKKNPDLAGS